MKLPSRWSAFGYGLCVGAFAMLLWLIYLRAYA